MGRRRQSRPGLQLAAVAPAALDDHVVVRELTHRIAEVSEQVRDRMNRLGGADLASQDVLIEVVRELEKQQWMLRAQLGEQRLMATSRGFQGRRRGDADPTRLPPGQYVTRRLPGAVRRADAAHAAGGVGLHNQRRGRRTGGVAVG